MSISLDDLVSIVMYRMYESTVRDDYAVMEPAYLAGLIQNGVTSGFVRIALEQLEDLKEIKFVPKPGAIQLYNNPQPAQLTPSGIRRVEADLRDAESRIHRYANFGIEAFEGNSVPDFDVPAADRLVTLDHNQPNYREIVEGLDRAIEEASRTRPNGVSGDEHASIVAGLKGAKELWGSFELTILQLEVGVLMAVERAQETLKVSFEMARGSLLVEAIKLMIQGLKQVDF